MVQTAFFMKGSKMSKQVIAIKKAVQDEATGAMAAYHVIEYVNADYKNNNVSVTLNGFVSEQMYLSNKRYLCSFVFTFEDIPKDANILDWLYRKIVDTDSRNVFAGAELVEKEI